MATLGVDQHQGLVGGHAAQLRGADKSAAVTDRLARHIVGGHQGFQHIIGIRIGHALEGLRTEDIHRHRRIRHRARLTARPRYCHLLDVFRHHVLSWTTTDDGNHSTAERFPFGIHCMPLFDYRLINNTFSYIPETSRPQKTKRPAIVTGALLVHGFFPGVRLRRIISGALENNAPVSSGAICMPVNIRRRSL